LGQGLGGEDSDWTVRRLLSLSFSISSSALHPLSTLNLNLHPLSTLNLNLISTVLGYYRLALSTQPDSFT
jgi:hypothetical protein